MKRIYYLLVVSLLCSLTASAYDFESGGIYFDVLSDNNVVVTSGDDKYSGDIAIPSSVEYNGKTCSVMSIGEYAFNGCSDLTHITIPNSVTSIGERAFEYCSGLTSLTIPKSVTAIGLGAFSGCSGLNSIKVEKGNPVYDSRNVFRAL